MNDIALFVQLACLWEVTARKPGNVHRFRDFPDLHFTELQMSGLAIGPVLAAAGDDALGDIILAAIRATRGVVRTNTNLGIVLLLAPLARVPWGKNLAQGVKDLLARTTVEDSRAVYEAIRLAQPGGLGEVPEQDITHEPTLPLVEIMALARGHDLVARQYADGFAQIFSEGLPNLQHSLQGGNSLEEAILGCHLGFLARHPDSLILRKRGPKDARLVQEKARRVLAEPPRERDLLLMDLDLFLSQGRNPGTTADLVAACLFAALREGIITLPLRVPWSSGSSPKS